MMIGCYALKEEEHSSGAKAHKTLTDMRPEAEASGYLNFGELKGLRRDASEAAVGCVAS
jgi:hypothetical protein